MWLLPGLLHDTVEDTTITLDGLRRDFGDEIARLVDGVTKLSQLPRVLAQIKKKNQKVLTQGKDQMIDAQSLMKMQK